MLEYGLTRDIIKNAMQSDDDIFRSWYDTFFTLLHEKNIPLIILSASGL
jgi:hypothetical protein